MDGDFRIDIDEIIRNIDSAEVISIYFPILRKAILIDTRFNGIYCRREVPLFEEITAQFPKTKRNYGCTVVQIRGEPTATWNLAKSA
jgi:hypothetical protein